MKGPIAFAVVALGAAFGAASCSDSEGTAIQASAIAEPGSMLASVGDLGGVIQDIKRFAGTAQVVLPGAEKPSSVVARIVDGFEQDPPRMTRLPDGSAIYWGWQEGQPSVQSIAIYDNSGRLRLVGAMKDIPVLYSWRSGQGISSEREYRAYLDEVATWGASPAVTLFVEDAGALEAYYPMVQRWLQAAMLGFNVDRDQAQIGAACAFVATVSIPANAYSLSCGDPGPVNHCSLPVPALPAADIDLSRFHQ